jgi:hypocretin (orexin) receptor 2
MLNGARNNGASRCSSRLPEDQLASRRKAAKMLIAIVVVFAICYLPVHLLNVFR